MEMLQVNVSLRDGGVVFKTFSKRAPDEAGVDTPDAVSRTAGAQTSAQLEPRRAPPAPQTRPSWTSGDQTFSTWAPDEAQQKEPSGGKKYSTSCSNEGAKSIRCRKKNGRRPQKPIWGKRALVVWVGSWCSSGVLPFLVALSGLLVLLVCLVPCLRVCWVLPGSGFCLFALFSVYGRRKTFRYSLPRVCITYYFFTNKNEVYAVLMELDETVRNCTFHLRVPSSSLSVVSSPLTRLSCVRLCTPSFPQRRHHACSSCDDCSE